MASPVSSSSSLNPPRRPSLAQSLSTPGKIMNGHFASVGEAASREQYENGIQIIDEDKVFKYVLSSLSDCFRRSSTNNVATATNYRNTSSLNT